MLIKILKTLRRNYHFKKKKHTIIKINSMVNFNTVIGKYSYIGYSCFITDTIIGNYTSIANNVHIGMGEHNYKRISTNTVFDQIYEDNYSLTEKKIIIEDDVWIGESVVILRGCKIGRGSVIGAGAVVTKDVPRYSIVVGVPGKVIKFRFDQEQIQEIENSKWWELDSDEAKIKIQLMEKEKQEK